MFCFGSGRLDFLQFALYLLFLIHLFLILNLLVFKLLFQNTIKLLYRPDLIHQLLFVNRKFLIDFDLGS